MSSSAFLSFRTQIQKANRLVRKQSELKSQGLAPQRDLDYVYEIAFLSSFIALENYIEERILSLLNGRSTSRAVGFGIRVSISSPKIAREFLYGGSAYLDFFPYERTEKVASLFFINGHPFTDLEATQKAELKLQHTIRNNIAHKSRTSHNKFKTMCVGRGINLPARNLVVHRYLQSSFSVGISRFEQHVSELLAIAQRLDS